MDEFLLVLKAWLLFLLVSGILGNSKLAAAANTEHAARKLSANIPGFLSINCGSNEDHIDEETGILYKSDTEFINTGVVEPISPDDLSGNLPERLKKVRSFPEGTWNCYTLRLEKGIKSNNYMIRAEFKYGNYDGKNQPPVFDLYLGVNQWATVDNITTSDARSVYFEIIHVPLTDNIDVCLLNTGNGLPFISALELRLLTNSIYQTADGEALLNIGRYDVGRNVTLSNIRYPDDAYDRIWNPLLFEEWIQITTDKTIYTESNDDAYKLPALVLSTAARTQNVSIPLKLYFSPTFSQCYVYFYFAEIEKLEAGQLRELTINLNDQRNLTDSIKLDYLKPLIIDPNDPPIFGDRLHFSIKATEGSELPPILNGLEVFVLKELPNLPTALDDVEAIMEIKKLYKVTRNWQGDPCVPSEYLWDGLNCSNSNPPTIISLNLSSSKLTGKIATSLSNFQAMQSLDLSYNDLTGTLPDFLVQLPKLKTLDLSYNGLTGTLPEFLALLPNLRTINLSGNKLKGSVPEAILQKLKDGKLVLRVDENPDLCLSASSCKKKNKELVIPIVASSIVTVLVLLFILSALVIYKRKRQGGDKEMKQKMLIQELGGHLIKKGQEEKDGQTSHDQVQFLSFESITAATNNFSTENKLGEGGFGPVYKGKLLDGKEIAIKRLSRSSVQGLVEFKNEALLIAKLQHANLVRLLGFCIQEEEKLLIYEYMSNKSLDFFLFDSTKKKLLTWKIRFNIIEGIAQGLVYLHKYSRPRVIHRDLKASNILLDDEMTPKISDFGMARIFGLKASEEMTNRVVGTYGYMSPEYAINGVVSIKTDVFSFGVLLLEIVSGKKNNRHYHSSYLLNLIGYAWQLWNEDKGLELIDSTLDELCPPNEVLRCIHIGLLCVQDHAADRPTMLDVVSMLSNETIQLTPPRQPAFFNNTVMEDPEVPEIQPESCSINNLTISVLETR